MIRSLRIGAVKRKKSHLPMAIRIAIASAAVLLVGLVGAAASQFVIDGELPLPGVVRSPAQILEAMDSSESMRVRATALALVEPEGKPAASRSSNGVAEVEELLESSRRKATEGLNDRDSDKSAISRAEVLAAEARREEARARLEVAKQLSARTAVSYEDFRAAEISYERYKREAEVASERYNREVGHDSRRARVPGPEDLSRAHGGWGLGVQAGQNAPSVPPGAPAAAKPTSTIDIGGAVKVLEDGEKQGKATFKEAGAYYIYIDNRPAAPPTPSTPALRTPVPAPEPVPAPQSPGVSTGLVVPRPAEAAQPGQPKGGEGRSGATRGFDGYFKPTDPAAKGGDVGPGGRGEGQGKGDGKGEPGGDPKAPKRGSAGAGVPASEKNGRVDGLISGRGSGGPGQAGGNNAQEKPPPIPKKIIIRSGDIEFEIDSFDSAVATVTKLVNAIPNGFVATVNSEKLPNGKVRGSAVVRVPPEALDGLVLDLRKELGKTGELKGQRIGSQDITKQYTDLESRLRAAKAMETRLLEIIKTGKGEIKDLLLAEKELGVWRTKIEETEGELRYYSSLVSLSTLTITLYEKEIRSAAAVIETERVSMGVEVEDVIKSLREAHKAVTGAKGRITKSELKQHAAGQMQAELTFEVASDAAGPVQDRLRQLGSVVRLTIDHVTRTEGGTSRTDEPKTKRTDAQFAVSLFNVANIAPRESMRMELAAKDAEAAYKAILARVQKAGGRVITSNLNRQRSDQTSGTVQFEVKSAEAEAVLFDLRSEGEVLHLQSTENPDTQNVTYAKRGFHVTVQSLYNTGAVAPHTTVHLSLAATDAEETYKSVLTRMEKAGGRIVSSNLNRQRNEQTQGTVHFEVLSAEADAVLADLRSLGEVMRLQSTEASGNQNVARTKRGFQVTVLGLGAIQPRETVNVQIATRDVPVAYKALHEAVGKAKGRMLDARLNEQDKQHITATLDFDLRRSEEAAIEAALTKAGTSIARNVSRAQDSETVIDTKVRYQILLSDVHRIPPRETVTLAVETPNVEQARAALMGLIGEVQGRTVSSIMTHERSGKVVTNIVVDVPVAQKDSLVEKVKSFGTVRVHNATRQEGVPEHALSVARLEIVLQGVPPIVAKDDGVWEQIRKGLGTSVQWIGVSLMWAVVGVSVVLPWALIVYGIVRLVMRWTRREEPAAVVPAAG